MTVPLRDPHSLPPPSSSGGSIRGAAHQILGRPEFQRPPKPWPQRVLDWLEKLFTRLTDSTGAGGSAIGIVVVLVILAVVVVLLVRFGRTVQRDPSSGVRISGDVGRPAVDWRAEAAAHEAAGRWRDALRCRYRALVADLAARGVVDEIPGRTSGEYRAEVESAEFGEATDLFERAWYGAVDAGPGESQRLAGLSERVLAEVGVAVVMTGRRAWFAGLVVLLLVALLIAGAPGREGDALDPDGTGPQGAKALVELLRSQGAAVDVVDGAPTASASTAIVLDDQFGDGQRAALLEWVRAGGTLVVADPRSPLAGAGGIDSASGPIDRNCDLPALREANTVDVGGGELFRLDTAPAGAVGCFGSKGQYYAVARSEGDGTVIALGGPDPFLNQNLGKADNSVLAASLLAPQPGAQVAFVRAAPVGGGRRSITDLISRRLKLAFWQLVIAFVLLCLWRARRLGRPVIEAQPVAIPGSELVVAVGNLLQQGRRRGRAASLLQDDLRRAMARRLSLGPDAPAEVVADVTAQHSGLSRDDVLRALTAAPPDSDAALLALAQSAESIRQEVLRAR